MSLENSAFQFFSLTPIPQPKSGLSRGSFVVRSFFFGQNIENPQKEQHD